jgi:hypothetical protein
VSGSPSPFRAIRRLSRLGAALNAAFHLGLRSAQQSEGEVDCDVLLQFFDLASTQRRRKLIPHSKSSCDLFVQFIHWVRAMQSHPV